MLKIFLLLLLPFFIYAKNQITTFFPLESFIVEKIAFKEIRAKEIRNEFSNIIKKPTRSEIIKFANVKIYFHLGFDVEKSYIKDFLQENPELIIVDMSKGIEKIDNNPYIWMDPILLRDVAKNVYEAFISIDNLNKDFYTQNYESFLNELDEMFLRITNELHKSEVYNLYVYDDYWYYFAKRFRLNLYKKDKKYINAIEIAPLLKYTEDNYIKKLLITNNESYELAQSLANNSNIQIIQNNIFDRLLLLNMFSLGQLIAN